MALEETHPDYDEKIRLWERARDCFEGEDRIKSRTTTYLPATESMRMDGMDPGEDGRERYNSYIMRASFPEYMMKAVTRMVSAINRNPPTFSIEDPNLEYLQDNATVNNESLAGLYRIITTEQMITGRLGILPDFPKLATTETPQPRFAVYHAENIRNWGFDRDAGLIFVILDESDYKQENFAWEYEERYRVLQMGMPGENGEINSYACGLFDGRDFNATELNVPSIRGNALDRIPFTFINATDLLHDPGIVPLMSLCRLSLSIYRSDADYRKNLFMQGEDTLVLKNRIDPDKSVRIGAGAYIDVGSDGDAKFIGVSSSGISEQRTAIENDKRDAKDESLSLAVSLSNESGEALKTRIGAQTLTLVQIAQVAAQGLEEGIRNIARWFNPEANVEDITVTPNTEFHVVDFVPADLSKLMIAKGQGAPISLRSIHEVLVEKGYTNLSFEEEMEMMQDEMIAGVDETEEDESNI